MTKLFEASRQNLRIIGFLAWFCLVVVVGFELWTCCVCVISTLLCLIFNLVYWLNNLKVRKGERIESQVCVVY